MYIASFFRTLFMICVPLFITTTGYLMNKKELSKKYYSGISRVLIVYVLFSVLYLIYCLQFVDNERTILYFISQVITFNAGYSWYIEMYIGLFLLIPFINLVYNNLKNKQEKQVLIFTLLLLTSIQGLTNIKHPFVLDWWIGIYPITYYFIGCYLSEFKIKISKLKNIISICMSLIISTFINIYISNESIFVRGIHNDWGSIFNAMTTILVFIFLINLKLNKINANIKKIIIKISEISFSIYLFSWFADDFIYNTIFKSSELLNFFGYFKVIPLVFIVSIIFGFIIQCISDYINKKILYKILKKLI